MPCQPQNSLQFFTKEVETNLAPLCMFLDCSPGKCYDVNTLRIKSEYQYRDECIDPLNPNTPTKIWNGGSNYFYNGKMVAKHSIDEDGNIQGFVVDKGKWSGFTFFNRPEWRDVYVFEQHPCMVRAYSSVVNPGQYEESDILKGSVDRKIPNYSRQYSAPDDWEGNDLQNRFNLNNTNENKCGSYIYKVQESWVYDNCEGLRNPIYEGCADRYPFRAEGPGSTNSSSSFASLQYASTLDHLYYKDLVLRSLDIKFKNTSFAQVYGTPTFNLPKFRSSYDPMSPTNYYNNEIGYLSGKKVAFQVQYPYFKSQRLKRIAVKFYFFSHNIEPDGTTPCECQGEANFTGTIYKTIEIIIKDENPLDLATFDNIEDFSDGTPHLIWVCYKIINIEEY